MSDRKIVNGSHETTIKQTASFEYISIGSDIYAFRQTIDIVHSDQSIGNEQIVRDGLVRKPGLTALRKGHAVTPMRGVFLASEELIEEIKRFGYAAVANRNFKNIAAASIFDYVKDGGSLDRILRFEMSDHSFWRWDGTIFPSAICFDYIDAGMHNLRYDLIKALDILKKRSDVTFFDPCKNKGVEPATPKIEAVPYYNADGGRSHYLSFMWSPTQEQAEALYTVGGSLERFMMIFANDWLDLRAGRAAFFDNFFTELSTNDDHDDDD